MMEEMSVEEIKKQWKDQYSQVENELCEKWYKAGYEDGVRETEKVEREKAKGLVEALKAEKLASLECVSGYDGCDGMYGIVCGNHARVKRIDRALRKWEGKV